MWIGMASIEWGFSLIFDVFKGWISLFLEDCLFYKHEFGGDLQVCCLAEHPQAQVVFNEVLSAGQKDGFKQDGGKQRGAWPVQEAYLVRIIYLTLFYYCAACNYVSSRDETHPHSTHKICNWSSCWHYVNFSLFCRALNCDLRCISLWRQLVTGSGICW